MSWLSQAKNEIIAFFKGTKVVITTPVIQTPAGDNDPLIAALEADIAAAIDAFMERTLGPVGEALVPATNAILAFAEQHTINYVASLFAGARTQAVPTDATVTVSTAPVVTATAPTV